jgi:NUMOD1 domain
MKNIKVLVLVITLVYSFFFGNLDFLSFSDFAVYLNFNAICVYSNADTQKTKIGVALGTAIEVTDLETGITIEFISMSQAAKELNISASSIRKYLLSQKSYKNRYLIKNKSNSVIKTEDGGNNTKEDEHLSGSFANSKLLKQYKESLGKLSQVQ